MAKRKRKNSYQQALPKWVISVFAVIAVILSILTFGGDMMGLDTSLLTECMNTIDRILYGGPTSPTRRCRPPVRPRSTSLMSVREKAS